MRWGARACLIVLTFSGCRNALPPLGTTPDEARRNADDIFSAFSQRFRNVERDEQFAAARLAMGRHALAPSPLLRDSTVWTSYRQPDSSSSIYLKGAFTGTAYRFESLPVAPYPKRVGDQRHFIRLRRVNGNNYEWLTIVDHAMGSVKPKEFATAGRALLTAFQGTDAATLRAVQLQALPNTSRHVAQLMSIDSMFTQQQADGSTSLALFTGFRTDVLKRRHPAFATFVEKYVTPSRYRFRLIDRSGATYFDAKGEDGKLKILMRARNGYLVNLSGTARQIPDSMKLHVDFSTKFKIFRVGFSNLVGDFTNESSQREHTWMMRFRREPKWNLPLIGEALLRSPLRTPFEGRGAEFRLSVRDDLGPLTMSIRHIRLVVNESAIMRFFNGLGSSAFNDLAGQAEKEQDQFFHEGLEALRRDNAALRW